MSISDASEYYQVESNAATNVEGSVPYLTEAAFLDFVLFCVNFEKTQYHQRHNDNVWYHIYCDVNAHSLCKAIMNNSVLISLGTEDQ